MMRIMQNASCNVNAYRIKKSRTVAHMERHERLAAARRWAGYTTASEAAEALGMKVPTYIGHENGNRKFNLEDGERYSQFFRVPFDWLYRGIGPAPKTEPRRVPVGLEFDDTPEPEEPGPGVSTLEPYKGDLPNAIPDIDVSAGAGPGGLALPAITDHQGIVYSADAIRGEIVFPQELLAQYTRASAGRVHSIAVRGDSMAPTLTHGDRTFVDTTDTAIGQGGLFVLRDEDGEVLVKRLAKMGNGEIAIISDNPKQPPRRVMIEDITIIGRVVARLSRPE